MQILFLPLLTDMLLLHVENDATLSKDQKVLAIQKELEEATALELPMMEQKLPNMHSALKM
jgi:hypothetical protein